MSHYHAVHSLGEPTRQTQFDLSGITEAISGLTERVHAYRFVRLLEQGDIAVAIEIKGIRAEALASRGHLDRIMAAYRKFNAAAPAHASDVEGLAEQISGLQSDLEFAATVLGNSDGSGASSQVSPVGLISEVEQSTTPVVNSTSPYPITLSPNRQR